MERAKQRLAAAARRSRHPDHRYEVAPSLVAATVRL